MLRGEFVEATVTFIGKGDGVKSLEMARPERLDLDESYFST